MVRAAVQKMPPTLGPSTAGSQGTQSTKGVVIPMFQLTPGTITQKMQSFGSRRDGNTMMKFIMTCTAGNPGAFPPTVIGFTHQLRGCRLEAIETDAGPILPSAFDVTLTDSHGFDLLGGAGLGRDPAKTERAVPVIASGVVGTAAVNGDTTLNITIPGGVYVSGANIVITIYFSK